MLSYLLPIGITICGVVIIYGVYRITQLRTELAFLQNEKEKYTRLYEQIETTRQKQELEIVDLRHHLQNANDKINNFHEVKEQAFTSAKSALFNLGNDLSKKLLDEHKRENQEVKQHSEQELKKSSQKFNDQFERISNLISVLNKDITESKNTTDLIKRSLLSPSGAGSLAEITLENMLKNLNLRKDIDFSLQQEFISSENNNKLRPDAIIFLPHNNLMVIDAKASKFVVEMEQGENKAQQEQLASSFIKTMYNHLRSLSSKEYAHHVKEASSDNKSPAHIITLMFLPSETAVDKICSIDPEFLEKAWAKNIYPVGPTGLMNMLSFAKFQITDNLRSNNQQLIISEVEKLLSATQVLSQHAAKMGNNLSGVLNYYDKFAASFNRNFLSKARNIQKLGITANSAKHSKEFEPLKRYMLVAASSDLLEVGDEQPELPPKLPIVTENKDES